MPFPVVDLPGRIVLVPSGKLDGQLRRMARDHPGIPADIRQFTADLHARPDGVPATLSEPRGSHGDWSLLLHTQAYVLRLFLTQYKDAYTIGGINPLRIRDHHRLARGCLLVRPRAGWQLVYDHRQIPDRSNAHWPHLLKCWGGLTAAFAAEYGAPAVTGPQADYLDMLDLMTDADKRITIDEAEATRPFPYRSVTSTGERRHGTHAMYEFQLADDRKPDEGAFLQIRGEPEQRGQVTRVNGPSITVRFDQRIDWERIKRQGELIETPSTIVFDKKREAVALLRTRQARNPRLLTAMVDHRLRPISPSRATPAKELDDDQLRAFHRALTVEDLLLVLGPPGTGKTRTISQIARTCALDKGERVLVTSHANRAVDNVLAKLPDDIVAIRVGHEGSVTEEGKPYLLEQRVAELRATIGGATESALASYGDLRDAPSWAAELATQVDRLTAAQAAETPARAELSETRRSVGGAAQTHVDRLTGQHRRVDGRLRRNRTWVRRLTRCRDWVRARTGWPLIGFLLGWLVPRVTARLDTALANRTGLRDLDNQLRYELAEAERELDVATRDDPRVRAARTSLDEIMRRRALCRSAALKAAREFRATVSGVATPPSVRAARGDGAAEATERDLASLHAWIGQRLPLILNRPALLAEWRDAVSTESDQLYPELIRYAHVIAATCIGAASRAEISDLDFDLAIVDEAGQIAVTDALVPLVRARRGVLVGDHNQLPPFLDSEVESWGRNVSDSRIREMLAKSALELLVEKFPDSHVVPLTWQRRMPAVVATFISQQFYGGNLNTAVVREHDDPLVRNALTFIDTARLPAAERHERSSRDREQWGRAHGRAPHVRERWGQPGFTNPAEAQLLTELAVFYHRRGAEWAVIVPYKAQVAAIRAGLVPLIGDARIAELNVGTVDSFQGGERDVLLYGFTRSNPGNEIGFLKELRRANVALTRVKHQLVLVGDMNTLTNARHKGFRELARALRGHLAEHGDIRQYREIRARLAELDARSDDA